MEIGPLVFLAVYIFCFVAVLSMRPTDQPWLPMAFQDGKPLRKLAPLVLALPVLAAPVLLLALTIYKAIC